jgi:hypothetical protein
MLSADYKALELVAAEGIVFMQLLVLSLPKLYVVS